MLLIWQLPSLLILWDGNDSIIIIIIIIIISKIHPFSSITKFHKS
jgi:hypothetical protein